MWERKTLHVKIPDSKTEQIRVGLCGKITKRQSRNIIMQKNKIDFAWIVKGTWRSALMSHSSVILLWSSSVSMVTLKFWGATRRELELVTCFNQQSYSDTLSVRYIYIYILQKLVSMTEVHFDKSFLDSKVPLLAEQQSWQWDSGFLSPKIGKSINSNYAFSIIKFSAPLHIDR